MRKEPQHRPYRNLVIGLAALFALSACNGGGTSNAPSASYPPDSSQSDPVNPPIPTPSPTTPPAPGYTTAVMLFNGTGVSTSDWQSTEQIIQSQGWSYDLVNSAQLNAMSLDQIASYGVIIVPGGEGGTIAGALTPTTQINVRQAVRDRGVGYVGFCAGAWIAVGPEAGTNNMASYGLAVAPGNVLPYWYPNGNTSAVAAVVPISMYNGSDRYMVWWGGPSTPEWTHGVIGRYSTGDPAISETFSGQGLVVISAVHPEAPQGWRATAGNDPDGLDFDIASAMVNAALNKTPMPTF